MNLQYHYMKQALEHVKAVQAQPAGVRDAYRGLTDEVPALVLTNGLTRTAAYVWAKSNGGSERARAFKLVREHIVSVLLSGEQNNDDPLSSIMDTRNLMINTVTLLDAWVYYKRFAAAYLGDPDTGIPPLEGDLLEVDISPDQDLIEKGE